MKVPAGVTTFPPFTIVSNLTELRTEPEAGSFRLVVGGLAVLFGFSVLFVAIKP
jgi:hypothetical protein